MMMEQRTFQVSPEEWIKLSHGQRRSHVNKERRRYRRTAIAKQKEAESETQLGYLDVVRAEEESRRYEVQRLLENAAWLERERVAQDEFRKKREMEDQKKREKEHREKLIKEEWEALQKKEREEQEAKDRERRDKEEKLKEALRLGDQKRSFSSIISPEAWHNPIVPADFNPGETSDSVDDAYLRNYGTEKDRQHCSFFLKTGACRFGERCSRHHPRLTSSCTLLVPKMYTSFGLQEQLLNERGQDGALEYDDRDAYRDFKSFYDDVLGEFSKAGKLIQFKVSCNHEAHLRGNVYVQYSTEEECSKAYQMFNGRWYAQKQLSCKLCPITKWKTAICGLYNQKRCPKGRNCNFLHVFQNPNGAFARADRDLPPLTFSPSHSSPPHSPHRRDSTFERSRSPRIRSPYYYRRNYQHGRPTLTHSGSRDRRRESSDFREQRKKYRRRSRSRSISGERRRHRRSRSRERSPRYSHASRWSPTYLSHSSTSRSSSAESEEDHFWHKRHSRSSEKKKKRRKKSKKHSGKKKREHKSKRKHSQNRHCPRHHHHSRDVSREGSCQDKYLESRQDDLEDKSDEDQDKCMESRKDDLEDKPDEDQDKRVVSRQDDLEDEPDEDQDKHVVSRQDDLEDEPDEDQDKHVVSRQDDLEDEPNEDQDKCAESRQDDVEDEPDEDQDKCVESMQDDLEDEPDEDVDKCIEGLNGVQNRHSVDTCADVGGEPANVLDEHTRD